MNKKSKKDSLARILTDFLIYLGPYGRNLYKDGIDKLIKLHILPFENFDATIDDFQSSKRNVITWPMHGKLYYLDSRLDSVSPLIRYKCLAIFFKFYLFLRRKYSDFEFYTEDLSKEGNSLLLHVFTQIYEGANDHVISLPLFKTEMQEFMKETNNSVKRYYRRKINRRQAVDS